MSNPSISSNATNALDAQSAGTLSLTPGVWYIHLVPITSTLTQQNFLWPLPTHHNAYLLEYIHKQVSLANFGGENVGSHALVVLGS